MILCGHRIRRLACTQEVSNKKPLQDNMKERACSPYSVPKSYAYCWRTALRIESQWSYSTRQKRTSGNEQELRIVHKTYARISIVFLFCWMISLWTTTISPSSKLTMSVNTPGLIRLIIFATWKTSTAFSFSSCWDRVVRAHNVPAATAPYLQTQRIILFPIRDPGESCMSLCRL